MLLPLAPFSFRSKIVFILVIVFFLMYNSQLLIYSIVWLFGALTFILDKKLINRYLSICLFLIVLLISRKSTYTYIDFSLAISLGLAINSIKFSSIKYNIFVKFNHNMADFSYSLYLFHFPFFVFIISLLYANNITIIHLQPTMKAFGFYFILLSFIYLYSYIMYMFFEQHTLKLKDYLMKKLDN